MIEKLLAVIRAQQEYIDAIPSEVADSFPAMPGFDRDWADGVIYDAKKMLSENKFTTIPSIDGLYFYHTASGAPEPVLIACERYGEGKFRGFNGRTQSWLRDGEYLVGPISY